MRRNNEKIDLLLTEASWNRTHDTLHSQKLAWRFQKSPIDENFYDVISASELPEEQKFANNS